MRIGLAFLGGLITAIIGIVGAPVHAGQTLVFGTYTFEKPTTTVNKLRPILDAVEAELSERAGRTIKIKMRVAKDYRSAIRDIVKGRVDFGRYGQATYVMAHAANRKIKVIAVEGDQRKKSFRSVIAVRKGSGVFAVEGLAGKSFAFGNEYSTTGRYLPQAFLARHGITAGKLSETAYLGRHDRVAWAVSDGAFDAGAMSEWVFQSAVAKGANLRPIAYFSSVTKPWLANERMDAEMQTLIRESLIALQGVEVLDKIKKDCFLPGRDSDYDKARKAISENWKFFLNDAEAQG